ncbi:MAG: hypothetical protein QG581_74 [Patescibacteria group bacterium]|nr:hypothetical protein [Patescibacteria group bacterium]
MDNQFIPRNKEKLVYPHVKWPLVSALALMIVGITIFLICEYQKIRMPFFMTEEVAVPVDTVSSLNTSEHTINQTYPTKDVTKRDVATEISSAPDPEWPSADEMREQLVQSGFVFLGNSDLEDDIRTFEWPTADEMKEVLVTSDSQ